MKNEQGPLSGCTSSAAAGGRGQKSAGAASVCTEVQGSQKERRERDGGDRSLGRNEVHAAVIMQVGCQALKILIRWL